MAAAAAQPSNPPQTSSSAPANDQPATNNTNGAPVDAANDPKKAAEQVAFYFSDVNLPYDRFLFTTSQVSLTASKQLSEPGTGWVSLTTILAFKRMQKFQQALGRDRVAQAIREHKGQFLKMSQDNTKVARIAPIVPPQSEDAMERSVYVKGFPSEESWADKPESLQEALEEFALQYGDINVVRMRREGGNDPKKQKVRPFKGSIFIEYKTKEAAQKLIDVEPKPIFEDMTEPVKVMSKADYCEMKANEKGIPQAKDFQDQQKTGPKKFNAFREMKQGAKRRAKETDEVKEYYINYQDKRLDVDSEGKLKDPSQLTYKKNTVLRFSNVDEETFNFRTLKKALYDIQPPTFVKKEQGESHGLVGFHDTLSDENFEKVKALDMTDIVQVHDGGIKWERLNDDDERAYHVERAEYYAKAERDKFRGPAYRAGRGQPGTAKPKRGGKAGGGRANNNSAQADKDKKDADKTDDKSEVKKEESEVKTEESKTKMEEDDKSGGTKRAHDEGVAAGEEAGPSEPKAKKAKTEES